VQKGQTLWRICRTYKVDMQDVAELNNITDHSQIKAGDRLFIPGATKQLWVATAPKPPAPSKTLAKPAPEPPAPLIKKNTGLFIWPLIGPITGRFGIHGGQKHDGIDIQGKPGAPVKASRSGTVVFSDWLDGYDNTVIIEHADSFVTVYSKLDIITVANGQKVKQSQTLGRLATAPAGKCSLHFQVRRYRKARNPLFYLPEAR
jgi:lipoprotein NlpD